MSDKTGLALEVAGASVANKVTSAGAVAGTVGWLVDINWIGLIGAAVAIFGLIANIYFQVRRDRREAAERAAREAREAARDAREAAESAARIKAMQDRCEIVR